MTVRSRRGHRELIAPRPPRETAQPGQKRLLVRPHALAPAVMVEMPTVEYRFISNFGEAQNDEPGLVMTQAGDVYLVNPDGTRTQLPGSGGGGGLPAGWTQNSDPANVNANGGTLTLGGGTFGNVPLLVFGDADSEKVLQVQTFDEVDMFAVDQDIGGTIVWERFLISSGESDGILDVEPDGSLTFGRNGLTSFSIDSHGQTHLGAIDADAVASLTIQASGEGADADAFRVNDFDGTPTISMKPYGRLDIVPTQDDVIVSIRPFGNSDILEVLNDVDTALVTIAGKGNLTVAPDPGEADSLTVYYDTGGVALRVGSNVGGVRAALVDGGQFSVCWDGTSLFAVDPDGFSFDLTARTGTIQTSSGTITVNFNGISLGNAMRVGELLDPTSPQEAATKAYVDAHAGLPSWFMSGGGSPVGSVTPSQAGAVYQDTDSGALYEAIDVTSADWLIVGGHSTGPLDTTGVALRGQSLFVLTPLSTIISDHGAFAPAASADGLYWNETNQADGGQVMLLRLGSTGQITHTWAPDGTYILNDSDVPAPLTELGPGQVVVVDQDTNELYSMALTQGIISKPIPGVTAFSVDPSLGATIALDADTLEIHSGKVIVQPPADTDSLFVFYSTGGPGLAIGTEATGVIFQLDAVGQNFIVNSPSGGGAQPFTISSFTDEDKVGVGASTSWLGFFGHDPEPQQTASGGFELVGALKGYGLIDGDSVWTSGNEFVDVGGTVPATNVATKLSWSHLGGFSSYLDFTDPTLPVFLADGNYAITLTLAHNSDAGEATNVTTLFRLYVESGRTVECGEVVSNVSPLGVTYLKISYTAFFAEGEALNLQGTNNGANDQVFASGNSATIVRLS